MAYNEDEDSTIGDVQETDGVNRAEQYTVSTAGHGSSGDSEIVDELNTYLMTPRYDNDMCVVLTMPVQVLKKAREKINQAILKVYSVHKSPEFKIFDVLVAMESMIDAQFISSILDIDIKRMIATDRGIVISDQQLEELASGKPAKKEESEDAVSSEDDSLDDIEFNMDDISGIDDVVLSEDDLK